MPETRKIAPFIRQTWVVSAVLLNMMVQSMVLSFPSVLLPGLKSDDSVIKTDLRMMSWLASVVGLTSIPGLLISAFLMERWGRKITQGLFILPGMLGWLLIYLATDVHTLMAGRILCSLSSFASFAIGAIIVGEYTSPQHRGMFLNLKAAIGYVGNTLVHTIGHYYSWKTVAIFILLPSAIAFGIVCTFPESPIWFIVKRKFAQSEKAWNWLRGDGTEARIEFDSIIKAQNKRLSETHKKSFQSKIFNFLQKFTKRDFLKPLFIIFVAMLLKEACGRHIFPAFALQIMENITGDQSRSFYYTLSIDLVMALSAMFSSALVRILNRRTLLLVSGGTSLVVLTGICICLYLASIDVMSKDRAWLPASMFMLYFVLTNLGCAVIPLVLHGEVFPVAHREARSAMTGLIMAFNIFLTMKITPALLISVEVYGTFAIYGATMALCLLVLYFILPETKDRTLQEIEDFFNHGRFIGDEKNDEHDEEMSEMLKNLNHHHSPSVCPGPATAQLSLGSTRQPNPRNSRRH